jgi:hypothetical protein
MFLGKKIDTTNKHTNCVLDAGTEVGLDTNVGITRYTLLPMHENARLNCIMKMPEAESS